MAWSPWKEGEMERCSSTRFVAACFSLMRRDTFLVASKHLQLTWPEFARQSVAALLLNWAEQDAIFGDTSGAPSQSQVKSEANPSRAVETDTPRMDERSLVVKQYDYGRLQLQRQRQIVMPCRVPKADCVCLTAM